jgi:hypothetical protein
LRIGFFVWEYPPALVGGLGTYAEYITREFVSMGNDVTVFTLNPGNLKTREIIKGVEVHRPLIADASNIFPMFVIDDLKKWGENGRKRVLQYFTWRKVAEQTLQIYEMLQHPQEQGECRVVDLMEKLTRT